MKRELHQDNLGSMRMQLLVGYKIPTPEEADDLRDLAKKLNLNHYELDGRFAIELPPLGQLTGDYTNRTFSIPTMLPHNFEIGISVEEFIWGDDAYVVTSKEGGKMTPFWSKSSDLDDPIPNLQPKRRSSARFIIWGAPESDDLRFWAFITEWKPKHTTVLHCEVLGSPRSNRLGINCILRDQGNPNRLSILNSHPELKAAVEASLAKARDAKDKSKDVVIRYGK
ncbi:MAG: hypothetical protein R3B38_02680 [Patescibacteria group bacterium]